MTDSDDELTIRVLDDGPGIPEAELERVFEPFYRLESSRNRATGGTGLGLSIARDVAQAHGGSLTLDESQRRRPGSEAGAAAVTVGNDCLRHRRRARPLD